MLEEARKEIDIIDKQLVKLIANRFAVVKSVWKYKKSVNMPVVQADRWQQVLDSKKKLWIEHGLSEDFIADIWNRIHEEAIRLEEKE